MAVVFNSFDSISVDGISAGNIVDVISNFPSRRVEVLDAYRVFTKSIRDLLVQEKDAIATELTQTKSKVDELKAKIVDLEQYRPFNPRVIDATKFFDRITKDEFAKLSTSDDATMTAIAKTIVEYKDKDYPVIFESQEMQSMLAYLLGIGFITEERKNELTADAKREEAYDAA